jgi:PAT family beta-lactamase induction signal transducer AmpG
MAGMNMLDTKKGRLTTFGILYVSEGIPLGFAAVAMAAYMRRQGMDVAQVGAFVAAFYLPWAFKWAWAPLVDLIGLQRFGGRKAWILLCQALMIVTLYAVAQIDHSQHFDLLIALVIVHNIFAATNDVAIDSLAVNALLADERGQGNGVMFGGAYLGQGLGGGGAMFVADRFGFDVSFTYVSALLLAVFMFTLLFVRDPTLGSRVVETSAEIVKKFAATLGSFLRELQVGFFRSGSGPLVGVLFALLPFGAMALTSGVSTSLQVDIGMSDGEIAELNIYSTVISAFGCVFGGWLADRLGRRKMLAAYYSLTILPTVYMAMMLGSDAGLGGISIAQYFAAALTFSLFVGMHYGTSAAIFMGLTNPAIAATQFTGFMALRNLTISYTNAWQGAAVEAWDYSSMLYIDAALAIIPILVIPFLAERKAQPPPPSMGAPLPEAG